ncbi:F-box/LRR-repeat protein At3g59200-like [Silene latifolia]|uniref:F-box/LRR-repeat protein At3g59200-like n=1 Tax=Silene latifolia TaxID=37657 RepID=UPI003D77690E
MNKKVRLEQGFDKISNLPEPITAHILSFLPTQEAVRMSILATSWRALWTQVSSLDLRCCNVPFLYAYRQPKTAIIRKRRLFYDFIDLAFESLVILEKVKLYVPNFEPEFKPRVDNWVDGAFGFKLRMFEFELEYLPSRKFEYELEYLPQKLPRYILPKIVFGSNWMTKLKLRNCGIKESCLSDIHLPSLCYLSLSSVCINEKAMESLLSSCPNLEDFNFDSCYGLNKLEILNNAKLKKTVVIIQYEHGSLPISIQAASLLEFICEYGDSVNKKGDYKIKFIGCGNMKKLKAISAPLNDLELHSLLENLPAIESLELDRCDRLRCIDISSPHLLHLELIVKS